MPQVDAAFEISIVGGHVVCADDVVKTCSGTTDRCHDIITFFKFGYILSDLFYNSEALVSDHEKIVTEGRGAILGVVDFLVSAIDSDPKDFDEHATPVWNICDGWRGHLDKMNGICNSGFYCNCFHNNFAGPQRRKDGEE